MMEPVKISRQAGLLAIVTVFLIGIIVTYAIMPPKVKASTYVSPVERNLGDCKVSATEIELTLTVYTDGAVTTHDFMCPTAALGANLRSYMTREGVFFDAYSKLDFWPGDVVRVKGPYYIAGGDTLVVYGKEWTTVSKVERPMENLPTSDSPTPTPTPEAY